MLKEALTSTVSFLVVGDPFGATTHSDLMIRAAQMGVKTRVSASLSNQNFRNRYPVPGIRKSRDDGLSCRNPSRTNPPGFPPGGGVFMMSMFAPGYP